MTIFKYRKIHKLLNSRIEQLERILRNAERDFKENKGYNSQEDLTRLKSVVRELKTFKDQITNL